MIKEEVKKPKTVAVVFARGKSKRLSDKHMVDIGGRPLIHYPLLTARSQCDHVFLSTDCFKLQHEAMSMGVGIIDRPRHLCTDKAPVYLAMYHAYKALSKMEWDYFVFLEGNTIYRKPKVIGEMIDILEKHKGEKGKDHISTVLPVWRFFPEWIVTVDSAGAIHCKDMPTNRKDLLPGYHADATITVYSRKCMKEKAAIKDSTYQSGLAYIYGRYDSIHIDDEQDLQLAKEVIKGNLR